jgi:Leucine-rich repeat (LRR) protein
MNERPQARPARKRWLRLRFGSRAFFIAVILLCVVLGMATQRAQQQKRICEQMADWRIPYELGDPPEWVQFLPVSLINVDDGHWCRGVKKVSLQFENDLETSEQICRSLKSKLALLAGLPRLNRLVIGSQTFTNDQSELHEILSNLNEINGLQSLEFETCQVNEVLQGLPELPYLTGLSISADDWASVHRAARFRGVVNLASVRKFPRLESLVLSSVRASEDDLTPLAKLTHLKEVRMTTQPVSGLIVECLTGHPNLEEFSFERVSCTDDVLRILATCPNLKSVDASGSLITDEGLACVASVPHLERIIISGTSITETGFTSLENCKSLTLLDCWGCRLSDAMGSTLKKLTKLKTLYISDTLATTNLLNDLQVLTNIEEIHFDTNSIELGPVVAFMQNHSRLLAESRVRMIWSNVANLFGKKSNAIVTENEVDLTEFHGISGELNRLHNVTGIDTLRLGRTDITDRDVKDIVAIADLRCLDISNTSVTIEGLADLNQLHKLDSLTIGPLEKLDQALVIISKMPSLRSLVILGGGDISEVGQDALASMSMLYSLEISNMAIGERFESKLGNSHCLLELSSANLHWDYTNDVERSMKSNRNLISTIGAIADYLDYEMTVDDAMILDASELKQFDTQYLQSLNCANVPLSHDALNEISEATSIQELDLSNTGIDDEGLLKLATLKGLERLNLSNNPISDRSIDVLLSFAHLTHLNLSNTRITDIGVARIFTSHQLDELDLSGTSVSDIAWTGVTQNWPYEGRLKLVDVPALSRILQRVPIDLLPDEIVIENNGFALSQNDVEHMRLYKNGRFLNSTPISPALSSIWPFEEVLDRKSFVNCLRINQTGQLDEIFQRVHKVPVRSIEITDESFTNSAVIAFPEQVRSIELNDCVLKTSVLEAMCKCEWLRQIKFSNCDIDDCSLEPLARVPMLSQLRIEKTALSVQQRLLLDQLRPKLGRGEWDKAEYHIP